MAMTTTSGEVLSAEQVESFFAEGYLIVENLLSDDEVATINGGVDRVWSDKSIYNGATISAYTGSSNYQETYLRYLPESARNYQYKLNHLYLHDPATLGILLSDKVQSIASQLLEGTPLMFNGLNFEKGSEQRFHFDSLYMPPRGWHRMVAMWFALEDILPGAGALQYYPKSHLIEPYRFSHGQISFIPDEMPGFDRYIDAEIEARGLQPQVFFPKKGDMFIWHSQLYHGGSKISDPTLTRKSMVNHFWRMEDYPAEQCWEVAPGRFLLRKEYMCVAPNFCEDRAGVRAVADQAAAA